MLGLGAISAEFVQLTENSGMYVISYPGDKTAKDVFKSIKAKVDAPDAQDKKTNKEGARLFKISR